MLRTKKNISPCCPELQSNSNHLVNEPGNSGKLGLGQQGDLQLTCEWHSRRLFLWFRAEEFTRKKIFCFGKKAYLPRNVFRRDEAFWLLCSAHGKGCGLAAESGMKQNTPGRGRCICTTIKKDDLMVTLDSLLGSTQNSWCDLG